MSEPAANARRKVSREGVVLLKSFEGFRARAERDGDGWVIGYGHRKSAREGLTVGEADAELLLQYDLLPIVAALNALPVELNAHQFDALASFAFSVGVERFKGSDVHARLAEGRLESAADALTAWRTEDPTVGLRRRAAERALFLADPERPVALADLLAAPLPVEEHPPAAEARAAAVAALLGEAGQVEPQGEQPPVVTPNFAANDPQPPAPVEVDAPPEPLAETAPVLAAMAERPPAPRALPHWSSPYGAAVIGPLPGFAARRAAEVPQPDMTPAPLPPVQPEPPAAEAEPAQVVEAQPEPVTESAEEPPVPVAPSPQAAAPLADWGRPTTSSFPPAPIEPLVLTPPPPSEPEPVRPVWGEDQRPVETSLPAQDPLFVEAPSQVSILRHEEEPASPHRFDWSETGMYVIMGGLGLVSCAVSAAAFRVAVEDPSPMGETTAVAWTLAVIGAVCVGAASWHLYVRTTRRKT